MKRVVALCVIVLFALALTGCGTAEGKYVGKYVSKRNGSVLEINRDGTFSFESKGWGGVVATGEWRIETEEGKEMVEFAPLIYSLPDLSKARNGRDLIQQYTGEVLAKQ